jgi:hypothetical protein
MCKARVKQSIHFTLLIYSASRWLLYVAAVTVATIKVMHIVPHMYTPATDTYMGSGTCNTCYDLHRNGLSHI